MSELPILGSPFLTSRGDHSRWAPSASERWFKCPGSLKLIDQLGPAAITGSSIYAQEGTAMHSMAEAALRKSKPVSEFEGDTFGGIVMEGEHVEAVGMYVNLIHDEWMYHGGELLIEQPFDLGDIWPGLFGKNDAMLLSQRTLRVYDLKGGKGQPVEVKENSQLQIYGLGGLRSLKRHDIDEVELVICQPRRPHRDGPIRRWKTTPLDLSLDFTNHLLERLRATEAPDAPLHAGEHCIFCPARGQCPELRRHALAVVHADFEGTMPAPMILTPQQLGAILHEVELIDEFVRAVKARAQQLAESGQEIPGWKLVPKRAMRRWIEDDDKTAEMLERQFGLPFNVTHESKLKSPAGIDKVLRPPQRVLLGNLYRKVSSGNNFVPTTDARDAQRPAIESDFTVIKDE